MVVLAVLVFSVSMFGCGKKQQAADELQEALSMESMSAMTSGGAVLVPDAGPAEVKTEAKPEAAVAVKAEELAATAAKPSDTEIQTALKNAGFYAGEIDGKLGPKTKKAIEEFQKANNLKADGKAGPKTWALLSGYLNPPVAAPEKKRR